MVYRVSCLNNYVIYIRSAFAVLSQCCVFSLSFVFGKCFTLFAVASSHVEDVEKTECFRHITIFSPPLSVCLCLCLSVCLSVYLLSVCLSVSQPEIVHILNTAAAWSRFTYCALKLSLDFALFFSLFSSFLSFFFFYRKSCTFKYVLVLVTAMAVFCVGKEKLGQQINYLHIFYSFGWSSVSQVRLTVKVISDGDAIH